MEMISSFAHLSNDELLTRVKQCARSERDATARLIAGLAELDARRLYLAQGCSSLFTYCTQVLHLSEHAAYGRIEAARAARRFPIVLQLLTEGAINVTTIGLLAPHLTPQNHSHVLEAARHQSKRDVEILAATLRPKPDVPSSVRRLPAVIPTIAQRGGTPHVPDAAARCVDPPQAASVPAARPVVAPLAPERFKVRFTVSRETYDKLRRAQDLLRHSIPSGDPAVLFDRGLTLLLAEAERTKAAAAARPRPPRHRERRSRHVPAAVKRAVWKRDGGQCAFVGAEGRCRERGFLEYHHVVPYADGGPTTVDNLQLRCRAHNGYESERWFGPLLARETAERYTSGGPAPSNPEHGASDASRG